MMFAGIDSNALILKAAITALKQKNCAIQSISFPRLTSTLCDMLVENLPSYRILQTIRFSLNNDSEHLKEKFVRAFRCNGSLSHATVTARFWNASDQAVLRYCTERNRLLPTLITSEPGGNAGQYPLSLWPRMFERSWESAVATGPNDAYRALLMLGDRVGSYSE